MCDSSGRERRIAALNPRSLRSGTAPKSTESTADKLHAMAHSTHFTMIRFMDLHMTWHAPACCAGICAPFAGVPGRIVTGTVALIRLDVGKPYKLRRTTLTSIRSHKRRQNVHGEDSDLTNCFARRVKPHEPCGQPIRHVTAAATAKATAAPMTATDQSSHRLACSHHQGRQAQLHGTGDGTRADSVQLATDGGKDGPGRP